MTQKAKEERIAYYLYKKGAKPNSSIFVATNVVAKDTKLELTDLQGLWGYENYFTFSNGTSVGLSLTKQGVDFVESKTKRKTDSLIKWVTFFAVIISVILGFIQLLK